MVRESWVDFVCCGKISPRTLKSQQSNQDLLTTFKISDPTNTSCHQRSRHRSSLIFCAAPSCIVQRSLQTPQFLHSSDLTTDHDHDAVSSTEQRWSYFWNIQLQTPSTFNYLQLPPARKFVNAGPQWLKINIPPAHNNSRSTSPCILNTHWLFLCKWNLDFQRNNSS